MRAKRGFNDDLVMSLAISMWLYDSSADYSRNSGIINQAMLDAMSVRSTIYDDSPEASKMPIEKKSLNNHNIETDSSIQKNKIKGWGKRINSKEYNWLI